MININSPVRCRNVLLWAVVCRWSEDQREILSFTKELGLSGSRRDVYDAMK